MRPWRSQLGDWLQARWYQQAPVPWWLGGLESLYRIALGLRRHAYASGWLRSTRLAVPVLVVGNLTVGGTGKTPLVALLARELSDRAWRPGIVLRGYGAAGRARLLPPTARPEEFGDEAVWLARTTGCPVAVGADRVGAARLLIAQGCDLVLSDDGLQHWALARDIEVLVIDGERRFGNGRLLPAGPLREPAQRAERVDYRVVNGGSAGVGEIPMRVAARVAVRLGELGPPLPLAHWRGQRVHAVAGIGHPERYFRMLESLGLQVDRQPWPDHHRFDGSECRFDDDAPVLVTEKDAVKLAQFACDRVYAVPIELELPPPWIDQIQQTLFAIRATADDKTD
ncbi:MAG: tetraacyldisaccharide 4'-kinase [Lysobacterales bacterium]